MRNGSANRFAWLVVALAFGIPAAIGQVELTRPVSCAQRVVSSLESGGMFVGPPQVECLAGIGAMKETASIRVVSVASIGSGTAKVKLRCRDNRECLPFYVLVHGLEGITGKNSKPPMRATTAVNSQADIVRGGDRAILVLESAHSRLSFPVICLQNGARGQRIRAASPDRRKFYEVEVVAPGMLRGAL